MSDTAIQETAPIQFTDFDGVETLETPQTKVETPAVVNEPAKVEEAPKPAEVPAVDYNKYVKEKFGFDSEEVALAEITRLKEAKQAEEIKFANEESKKAFDYLKNGKEDDLYSFLSEKKKIEKLATATIDNVNIAAEVIKLSLQKKYKDLTEDEIEYQFNRQFQIPAKPVQELSETDEEYEVREAEWKEKKAFIEKGIIIEAKTLRPDIEKFKSELVLPDLEKPKVENDNQEDLVALQKLEEEYTASIDKTVNSFKGVTLTAKYGDVELPISYIPTESDKTVLNADLRDKDFVSNRWFDDKGVPKAELIADDIFFLKNKQNILQKVANEAAAKAVESYIASRSNVKLNGEQQRTFNPDAKPEQTKMAETIWDA